MRHGLYVFIFFVLAGVLGGLSAQNTFNHRYVFNRINTVFTGVAATDSAYYVIGIITDTIPYTFVGASLMTFNLQGERIGEKVLKEPGRWFETWSYNLIPTPRHSLLATGYTAFPRRGFILEYFPALDSIRKVEFDSPWGADSFYGLSNGLIINGNEIILNPNIGSINSFNSELSILRFNENLFLSGFQVFPHPWSNLSGGMCFLENDLVIAESQYSHNVVDYNFISLLHLFALDDSGQKTWEYTSPLNESWIFPYSLLPTPDGGLLVAVAREYLLNFPSGPTDSISIAVREPWVMKLNSAHERAWAIPIFDEFRHPINQSSKIIPATDGNGYVAAGFAYLPYPGQHGAIGLVNKITDEGEILWSRRLFYMDTVTHEQYIYDLQPCTDGGYLMCGQVRQPPDTINPTPTQQGWLLKVDQYGCLVPGCQTPVAAGEPEAEKKIRLLVYPNPASDMLAVHLAASKPPGKAFFRLVDSLGRVLRQEAANEINATYLFPVGDWPPGQYYLQYWADGELAEVAPWVRG